METTVLNIDTGLELVTDLTPRVEQYCAGRGDGLLHVFAPHATAGLALIELGSGSEADLAERLARLLPRDDRYRHRHGTPGAAQLPRRLSSVRGPAPSPSPPPDRCW